MSTTRVQGYGFGGQAGMRAVIAPPAEPWEDPSTHTYRPAIECDGTTDYDAPRVEAPTGAASPTYNPEPITEYREGRATQFVMGLPAGTRVVFGGEDDQ